MLEYFLNKVTGYHARKKEAPTQVFYRKISEIVENIFFHRIHPVTASVS